MTRNLILASASKQRQQLLQKINIPFIVAPTNINEAEITEKDPREKVKQLASMKGRKAISHHPHDVVIAADTVVSYKDSIFEKPLDREEAFRMMQALSGKTHEVYTGVVICTNTRENIFVERTKVEFWPLERKEIDWYVCTDDPYDKAGAYGIQSLGAMFVKKIEGDYYNVVGLPISRVVRELRRFSIYPER